MKQSTDHLAVAKHALARAAASDVTAGLPDVGLLESTELAEKVSRLLDVVKARHAAELARRSRPELGHAGLAAREGHVNAEALVRARTRTSWREAARRIRVGTMLAETSGDARAESAFSPIAAAVANGDLGVEAADGVIRALTPVTAEVDLGELQQATGILAVEAVTRNADDLGVMARGVRDTLDRIGVHGREEHRREQRCLRRGPMIDGLRQVTLVLDQESDAVLSGAIDTAMSPRLGGPRFTDPADKARAARLIDDPRTNEQMELDVLVDLVRIGTDRDDGSILGSIKPAVRVTIPLSDLTRALDEHGHEHPEKDTGVAWLEGYREPVSAATARRILCDSGALPIILGGGSEPLDLGHGRRLFSRAQRTALANRDGGCRWPDCDRPPSWSEAHHINPHSRAGLTNLNNGILLCRRHHLILHDNGWHIDHGTKPGEFLLTPPRSVDPTEQPRAMPTKIPPWLNTG